jgi:alpha-L-fucosidase
LILILNRPLITLILLLAACAREVKPPAPAGPVPTDAQLAWHAMETNAFIHFTINTFTDKEWGYGDESPALFNPTHGDVDQWVSTLKGAGFRGIILTTKHHDGFCLWPSRYTEHTIKSSPYQQGNGDIVKEVSEACKRYGLKFGLYVSPWDRNHPDYGTPAYVTYYRNQLEELFTSYGPVFEMWFDGANGGDGYYGGAREKRSIQGSTYYDWPTTLERVRAMEPNVIFFSDAGPGVRWVGNEKGVAGETNWNTITPDTLYAGKAGIESLLQTGSENGTHWIPAETDVSIRPGWFFHASQDSLVKTPEQLFDIYLASVGRGSTLLLNVPPDRRGRIHPRDSASLMTWRAMIDSAFAVDLSEHAQKIATHARGNHPDYDIARAFDNHADSYWATDDDVSTADIALRWSAPQRVEYIVLQEYIRLGQRVKRFSIEVLVDDQWQTVFEGTTIGYKRIARIKPMLVRGMRIRILESKACPVISEVGVF